LDTTGVARYAKRDEPRLPAANHAARGAQGTKTGTAMRSWSAGELAGARPHSEGGIGETA
jgi:hypothetical protein